MNSENTTCNSVTGTNSKQHVFHLLGTCKLKKIIDPGVKAVFTVNMLSHFDFVVF